MKQVIQNYRSGELRVDDVPAPLVRPQSLLVSTRASIISPGTEKATVDIAKKSVVGKAIDRPDLVRKVVRTAQREGLAETVKMVSSRLDADAVLGYSSAGTVIEIGEGVEEFAIGDRVACAGQNYASHAEMVCVPKNLCVKIPAEVRDEDAAYATLGAIALQGVRQADPKIGEFVGVIGLGLVGQLTVQILRANGCLILAADLNPERRELAARIGADRTVAPEELVEGAATLTNGRGLDSVIITAETRSNEPVETAATIARRKGRIVVVGAVGMDLPRESFYRKELELRLSTSYGPGRYDLDYEEKGHDYPYGYVRWTEQRNMSAFLNLVASGKVDTAALTTHRFEIAQAADAYELIRNPGVPSLGVVLHYPEEVSAPVSRKFVLSATQQKQDINLGVIGAGNHVKDRLLGPLQKVQGVHLAAIGNRDGSSAKAVASKFGAGYCTTDYREILDDGAIDAVVIGTRHDLHGALVVEALEHGKHVFVEKPLCLTDDELEEIADLYEKKARDGLNLFVGFNRTFSEHFRAARDFLAGRGDPLVMTYRVNANPLPHDHWIQDPTVGGGRIIGEACHFVDYLQALCGHPLTGIRASRIGGHSSGQTQDQAIISLEFADGSIGNVVYAAGGDPSLPKERCEVLGAGRAVILDDFTETSLYRNGKRKAFKTKRQDKGFAAEMRAFCAAVKGDPAAAMSFDRVHAVTLACLRAVDSLRSGERYPL